MTVGQEGESSSGGLVGVVDVGEDVDGLGEPLLLDQTIDGAGVLPILDIKLVVHDGHKSVVTPVSISSSRTFCG